MSKQFQFTFGVDPRVNTSVSPTFILFYEALTGQTLTPPGITQTLVGSGFFSFEYGATYGITTPVNFLIDGGAGLGTSERYVQGSLSAIQTLDTSLGDISASYGSTTTDPPNMYGLVKRLQEFMEGDKTYTKATGVWTIYDRGGTLAIQVKTLSNNTTASTST